MTHHMRELDPTGQDEVKRMAHSMKGHITGGHDNTKQ
jgi:phosphohistidine phosphatase SixA